MHRWREAVVLLVSLIEWPVGSQLVLTRIGGWDKAIAGEGGAGGKKLWGPLETDPKGEGRLQQIFCCRARDDAGGLNLEAVRDR